MLHKDYTVNWREPASSAELCVSVVCPAIKRRKAKENQDMVFTSVGHRKCCRKKQTEFEIEQQVKIMLPKHNKGHSIMIFSKLQ